MFQELVNRRLDKTVAFITEHSIPRGQLVTPPWFNKAILDGSIHLFPSVSVPQFFMVLNDPVESAQQLFQGAFYDSLLGRCCHFLFYPFFKVLLDYFNPRFDTNNKRQPLLIGFRM